MGLRKERKWGRRERRESNMSRGACKTTKNMAGDFPPLPPVGHGGVQAGQNSLANLVLDLNEPLHKFKDVLSWFSKYMDLNETSGQVQGRILLNEKYIMTTMFSLHCIKVHL